jgi:hypothetical protein
LQLTRTKATGRSSWTANPNTNIGLVIFGAAISTKHLFLNLSARSQHHKRVIHNVACGLYDIPMHNLLA